MPIMLWSSPGRKFSPAPLSCRLTNGTDQSGFKEDINNAGKFIESTASVSDSAPLLAGYVAQELSHEYKGFLVARGFDDLV